MNKRSLAIREMSDEDRRSAVARSIRAKWDRAQSNPLAIRNIVTQAAPGIALPISTYSGSDLVNTNSDFLGDWRSVDSWTRMDMQRVRYRSRQVERGNQWCRSIKISLINNVLGWAGFSQKNIVKNSMRLGDLTEGTDDKFATSVIAEARELFEKEENFTTRKKLSRHDVDALLVSRWFFDGEVIIREIRKFDNEFGFSWQLINPDYLDHNLNRLNPDNGNFIKMGVEQDLQYKFPVAYWFLHKRPNDYWYNDNQFDKSLYYRVPADEIIHIFAQTEDDEQTRGWPMMFAALVNLHRLGKYEEAALINATIGASKMGFFKKIVPDGFAGDPSQLTENGDIIDEVVPGSWQELPWNMEPVKWDPQYPDAEFEPFEKAMLRGIAACAGMSYASTTGDLSENSFSSSRVGQTEEREHYMAVQGFWIRKWKKPEYERWLWRTLLSRKLTLPISKFDKFNHPEFTGRRWPYVNPIQDMQAKQLSLDMCATSITAIIEEQGGDRDKIFAQIAKDQEDMDKLQIKRIHGTYQLVDFEDPAPLPPPKTAVPAKK